MTVSNKFVTLNFSHDSKNEFVAIMHSVLDNVKFDAFETYTEEFEGSYRTDVYLTGDIETILRSVEVSYENKSIDCSWNVDTLLD